MLKMYALIIDYPWCGPAGLHEGTGGEDARPPAAVREVPQVDRQGAAHPGRRPLQDGRRRVQGQFPALECFISNYNSFVDHKVML